MTGIELITKERQEQVEKHGYNKVHDKLHMNRELLIFAEYCIKDENDAERDNLAEYLWDMNFLTPELLEKINNKSIVERLVIAGALIAAEIDRIS